MDLAEFLLARITEDRVLATRREWHTTDCETIPNTAGYSYPCDCGVPERMTREADAKQRIMEHFQHLLEPGEPDISPEYDDGYIDASEYALKVLTSPYADHPDYRQEWKV